MKNIKVAAAKNKMNRSICGLSIFNNDKVDLIDQLTINNNTCSIYVGACSAHGLKPHYHILSAAGELIIAIEDGIATANEVIEHNNWNDIFGTLDSLEQWLTLQHNVFYLLKNHQYIEMFYDVNNPNNKLPDWENFMNVPRPNNDEICATIHTNTNAGIKKGYMFALKNEELPEFESQFRIGDNFEGNTIARISIS